MCLIVEILLFLHEQLIKELGNTHYGLVKVLLGTQAKLYSLCRKFILYRIIGIMKALSTFLTVVQ
ncbi:unnamed protein product [Acanthoscelides obtectus]|uniref:Uncharacterized protein n=1 Tax=Acanthoscelides obtectus TaxID=200917 RepID=A0A9P0L756_ACAOB|nr:unnamed protein product [Acanthoscelides obtectus]CAK1666178.1 hypothetical protein AOBTE_LOCUS25196 [Acanthoscelides obtectus]